MNEHETPETILAWGRATFGEPDLLGTLVRANLEMAELVSAISCGADVEKIAMEMADVDIVCSQAAAILDVDISIEFTGEHVLVGPLLAMAILANSNLADIMAAVAIEDRDIILERFTDLYWCLRQLAQRYEVDLQEYRDSKMKINRARSWARAPEGHFQHVKETDQ